MPAPQIPIVEVESQLFAITPIPPSQIELFSCDSIRDLEQWGSMVLTLRIELLVVFDSIFTGPPSKLGVIDELQTVLAQYRLLQQYRTPDCAEILYTRLTAIMWNSLEMLQSYGNNVDTDYSRIRGEIEIELDDVIQEVLDILSNS